MLAHFLALDEDDRLLRFGQIVLDHVIENYVHNLNFANDIVFGASLELIGVGHLAYLPAEGDKRTAEFGVSVRKARAAAALARNCSNAPPCAAAIRRSPSFTCIACRAIQR